MNFNVMYLKDKLGLNYLGIKIPISLVNPFLDKLKNYLGDKYDEYTHNQKNRDLEGFHLTVLNVEEYNNLSKGMGVDKFINSLEPILKSAIDDIKFLGLGSASKNENTSYFVVCKSELLDEIRRIFGLDEKDFHITLGFKHKDVYGVRKNQILKINEPFLTKLMRSFYKEGETFEFIKGIKNFDYDFFKLIEPIKINDTTADFRCGEVDYFSVSLVDDQFLITSKWQDIERHPILSDVLINKKFKNLENAQ